jgi:hypothetical protein
MTRLVLAEDRLPDPTFDRHSKRGNSRSAGYRFGRVAVKRVDAYAARSFRAVKASFKAVLKMIAAAKIRRLARELRLHQHRYDRVRFDGDRFTLDSD